MSGWHIMDKLWPMCKHSSVLLYTHRNHKDGEPRTATSTSTQLLNSVCLPSAIRTQNTPHPTPTPLDPSNIICWHPQPHCIKFSCWRLGKVYLLAPPTYNCFTQLFTKFWSSWFFVPYWGWGGGWGGWQGGGEGVFSSSLVCWMT